MGRRTTKRSAANVEIGSRVSHERDAAGVSRDRLADELGIHVSVLGRIENGEVSLSAERAHLIATYLGISIARLYGEHPAAAAG